MSTINTNLSSYLAQQQQLISQSLLQLASASPQMPQTAAAQEDSSALTLPDEASSDQGDTSSEAVSASEQIAQQNLPSALADPDEALAANQSAVSLLFLDPSAAQAAQGSVSSSAANSLLNS